MSVRFAQAGRMRKVEIKMQLYNSPKGVFKPYPHSAISQLSNFILTRSSFIQYA
jgi:hypothetical protein